MDIVDNNVVANKYINLRNKRHVSSSNNIAHWLKLRPEYFGESSISLINKYKKIINQKNIKIMIKCLKYNINMIPILYELNDNDINMIIKESLYYNNNYMIKIIVNQNKTRYEIVIKHIESVCHSGNIKLLKLFHRVFKIPKQYFQSNHACRYHHVSIIKYFHKKVGLTKSDFEFQNNDARNSARHINGHVNVVKYLHKKISLEKKYFEESHYYYCFDDMLIVKYLCSELGFKKSNFDIIKQIQKLKWYYNYFAYNSNSDNNVICKLCRY